MTLVDPEETLRAGRARYFEANGFGDGGYEDRWVKLSLGPFALYFPNSKARVRAVRFHDLHHVLTGYATTWVGEAEIGAWEVASGCAHHHAAWLLNLLAVAIGLFLAPGRVRKAFARGRRSRNLYREDFNDDLLDQRLAPMRQRLGLDQEDADREAGPAFPLWCLLALVVLVTVSALPWLVLGALTWAAWGLVTTPA